MSNLNGFEFVDVNALETSADDFVAVVPAGITSAKDLLRALAEALRFPEYFGFNWNALYDCLRDFHWLEQDTIVLAHQDAPALQASTLETYLDVLRAAMLARHPDEPHLRVVFPADARPELERLLAADEPHHIRWR